VAISQTSGEIIAEAMAGGDVEATVTLVIKTLESRNVIAEKPGTGDGGAVLILGAHYDTVPETQGANDNGSGLTSLLMIAREVAGESFPFTLRFIAFGSEEVGLFGSRHYVSQLADDEAGNIVAMLNFDVPGSGNQVQVIGSADLVRTVLAYGDATNIGVRAGLPLEGGGSDHVPFRSADIPTLFFLADDLSRINSVLDTIEFVDRRLMGETVALALGLLDDLARQSQDIEGR
jgi:aminopeptidase YwaD